MTNLKKSNPRRKSSGLLSEVSEKRLGSLTKYASRLDSRDLQVAVPLAASPAKRKQIVEKKLEEIENNLRKTFAM